MKYLETPGSITSATAGATGKISFMISFINRLGKNLVRRQLKLRGWRISRRVADNGPTSPLLLLLIKHFVLVDGQGAILEIGANDGVLDDPIHEIISTLNLPAILVEPLPTHLNSYVGIIKIRPIFVSRMSHFRKS
jgi:hypothetical protein